MREPDAAFSDPRLAVLYDVFNDDRSDLRVYVAIAAELAAHRVVDLGCGTGSLAVLLTAQGLDVVGVDPAEASLAVARRKPEADRVRWVLGDAGALSGLDGPIDLVLMTGNVAQVFVDDGDWSATLASVRSSLCDGGWFVFETRRPEARAWEDWDVPPTELPLGDGRSVTVAGRVTSVELPLVSFRSVTRVVCRSIDGRATSTRRTWSRSPRSGSGIGRRSPGTWPDTGSWSPRSARRPIARGSRWSSWCERFGDPEAVPPHPLKWLGAR